MNEIFGWYAGFVYSLYLIPQIIKTYTTKSVEDLSIVSLWITFSGGFGMFLYLFQQKGLYPVKFKNVFGLLSISTLLILYYKYKKGGNKALEMAQSFDIEAKKALEATRLLTAEEIMLIIVNRKKASSEVVI
tara:strand:+ start:2794 stop:3189 length:396 start_codon:yes stop_codon:yes gene_type:complete